MTPPHPLPATVMYLVRHGATTANEQVPFVLQGRGIDLPLSPNGERQALAVAELLRSIQFAAIYSSEMRRARQTAASIAAGRTLDVQPLAELHEADVGLWEGLNWNQIAEQYPAEQQLFLDDPGRHPHLGGESYADVQARVTPVFAELLARHAGQRLCVVAHTVVNRVYLASLLGVPLSRSFGVRLSNGGVSVVREQDGKTLALTVNAVFHLEGTSA